MAGVLETLTVPRSTVFPTASLSPIVSRLSGRRNVVNLPDSRGLKIQSFGATGSVNLRSKIGRRGARIVCEAQGAVQGLHCTFDLIFNVAIMNCSLIDCAYHCLILLNCLILCYGLLT